MSELAIEADRIGIWFPRVQYRPLGVKEAFLERVRGARAPKEEARFWAMREVSFQIAVGEVVGVLGRNGCGKSTLLKMIAGIYAPDEGTLVTRGRISSLLELGAGFREELTGRENIALNGAILGFQPAAIEARAKEIIDYSGLERFIDQPLRTYSSGMKVRLGFAVASVIEPEILLIDEVLGVGDEQFRQKSMARIRELVEGHSTVLVVSHNLAELERICHRIILLDQGRKLMEGPPAAMIEHYRAAIVPLVRT